MLKMLGMQMLVPKLKEMSLDDIAALRAVINELFDAASREKVITEEVSELKRLPDGG